MQDQALRNYFRFDEADLDANRNGRLSEKQKKNLIQENKSSKRFGIGCGVGAGLLLFAVASIFPFVFIPIGMASLQKQETSAATGSFIAAAAWALVWGGIGLAVIIIGIKSAFKDRSKVLLKNVTGPVNLIGVQRRSGGEHPHTYIAHELHIGREEFDVSETVAGSMMQGDIFTVYYIQEMDGSGKRPMSVEWRSRG